MEAILNSSFDWNGIRQPYLVATENEQPEWGVHVVWALAHPTHCFYFADVRTYWSAESRQTGSPLRTERVWPARGLIHLINSGAATLDATGWEEIDGRRR